jgi:archaeal chaperonin
MDLKNRKIDIDDIKIEEKLGSSSDTMLIRGTVFEKSLDRLSESKYVENAKILPINENLDRTKTDCELSISSYLHLQKYYESDTELLKRKLRSIINSGDNVVVSQKGIGKIAREYLTRANIISIRKVKENDMLWLEKPTDARITRDLDYSIPWNYLGYARRVYERLVGSDKMVFIDECRNPKTVTLFLGKHKRVLDEYHRSALDGFAVLKDYILSPRIVGGDGSTEAKIAATIRNKSKRVAGRVQLVLQKFAHALEEIPITLARNSGMDTINVIVKLRSNHSSSNGKIKWYGIDSRDRDRRHLFLSPRTICS